MKTKLKRVVVRKAGIRNQDQATPRRDIIVTKFVANSIAINGKVVDMNQCASSFILLLSQALDNYKPAYFRVVQPPANALSFTGNIIFNSVAQTGPNKYSIGYLLYIFEWHENASTVSGYTAATLQVLNPPTTPDGLFNTLSSSIAQSLQKILGDMASSANWNLLPWSTKVVSSNNGVIGIPVGTVDNINVGNLFEVMRPLPGSTIDSMFVSGIQVTNVQSNTALCKVVDLPNHEPNKLININDDVWVYICDELRGKLTKTRTTADTEYVICLTGIVIKIPDVSPCDDAGDYGLRTHYTTYRLAAADSKVDRFLKKAMGKRLRVLVCGHMLQSPPECPHLLVTLAKPAVEAFNLLRDAEPAALKLAE